MILLVGIYYPEGYNMKNPIDCDLARLLLAVYVCWLSAPARATTYYVDATGGADSNSGLSPGTAWKSLGKVNSTTFAPGDRILLAADNRWEGKLNPKGSGTPGKPIVVDRYGAGTRPIIDGAGSTGDGAVYLYNQQYWEIANLEITNDATAGGDRRGVMVAAANSGMVHHIHLKNLYIHHIKGIIGQSLRAKDTGAIGIYIEADDVKDTRFDDILI